MAFNLTSCRGGTFRFCNETSDGETNGDDVDYTDEFLRVKDE